MKELAAYDTLSQKYGFTDAENRKCAAAKKPTKATESEILLATILEELRGLRADFKSYVEKAGKHLTGGY